MEILYDDLGVILETSLQGCVERRIKTLTILAYDTGKKRFGVEDRKERRNTKQAPNSREQKIKHIRKELKDLSRRYKRRNKIEIDYLSCIWHFFLKFCSLMLFNFLLYLTFLTSLDSSVNNESFVDKTRVWRKYKI